MWPRGELFGRAGVRILVQLCASGLKEWLNCTSSGSYFLLLLSYRYDDPTAKISQGFNFRWDIRIYLSIKSELARSDWISFSIITYVYCCGCETFRYYMKLSEHSLQRRKWELVVVFVEALLQRLLILANAYNSSILNSSQWQAQACTAETPL